MLTCLIWKLWYSARMWRQSRAPNDFENWHEHPKSVVTRPRAVKYPERRPLPVSAESKVLKLRTSVREAVNGKSMPPRGGGDLQKILKQPSQLEVFTARICGNAPSVRPYVRTYVRPYVSSRYTRSKWVLILHKVLVHGASGRSPRGASGRSPREKNIEIKLFKK